MAAAVMTLPRHPGSAPSRSSHRGLQGRASRREPVILFLAAVVVYALVGGLMAGHNVIFADALSRVGNAVYVLYSRDPHLPAMGFVWNPLPSLSLLPLLPFKGLWPSLITVGLAGVVQSVLCMAGTVVALAACLRKLSVPTVARLVLVAVFAVQPMILLYAGSGLSEPMFMLFLAITTSQMLSWIRDRGVGSLVGAGLGLGGAYLTRYEAIAPAAAVALLVAIVTWFRSRGSGRSKLHATVNDVALVAAPFLFTFVMWAVMAKVIVGEWFPTFTSAYGNSAQVTSGSGSIKSVIGTTPAQIGVYVGRQITALAPLFVILLLVALVVAIYRRDVSAVVGPTVFGAVLAFDELAALSGLSFGWLRFQIMVIPLTVLSCGTILGAVFGKRSTSRGGADTGARLIGSKSRQLRGFSRHRLPTQLLITVLALVAVTVAVPTQLSVLVNSSSGLAREESPMLRSLLMPNLASHEDKKSLLIFQTERSIAADLDRLNLPDGSVLTDTAYAYSVVLASERPRQFVITSDLDFVGAVADPTGHHVQYLLVPGRNLGPADALRRHWPSLYDNGAGLSTLVRTYRGAFFGDWRLYQVN